MKVEILGGAYQGRSSNVSPQTCINLFYEKGVDGECLVNTPGATEFADLGNGEVRGGILYNDNAFFVCGNKLYEVSSTGAGTERGTLDTSSGRVSMAHNGTRAGANQQLMIVDGATGYIYDNTTSTLTEIADTDFTDSRSVVFIDGFFLFAQQSSDRFWLTGLYDGTTIDSTDFSTAEGSPDEILSLVADRRELFIFGKETMEVWYNSGDADNTFQRFQGGFTQTGCAAAFSPARGDNNICWLTRNDRGHGLVAQLSESYQPSIISTPEVNYQISTYTSIEDAFGYTYQHEGHEFYALTFPGPKVTWVYDFSTQVWHQRAHTIDGVFPNRERYNCHVFAFGKHLMGDMSNGKIYELDPSVATFDGERVPRVRTTGILTSEEQRIRLSSFQLDMEEGVGDPNEEDTLIYLSYSKDGGHTWSDEIARSIGDTGEYAHRVIWRKLGMARNWIFKVRTWSPKRVLIKGAYARPYGSQ